MNWFPAVFTMSIAVLVGTGVAFLMHKTLENMERAATSFRQIAKDLTRIYEIRREVNGYINKTKS